LGGRSRDLLSGGLEDCENVESGSDLSAEGSVFADAVDLAVRKEGFVFLGFVGIYLVSPAFVSGLDLVHLSSPVPMSKSIGLRVEKVHNYFERYYLFLQDGYASDFH
jgi:hypothetical protein